MPLSKNRHPWARLYQKMGWIAALILVFWFLSTRHQRAWSRMKADLIVRGEPMTFEEVFPPRIPDEENFAAQPLIEEYFKHTKYWSTSRLGQSLKYYQIRVMDEDESIWEHDILGCWYKKIPSNLILLDAHYRRHPEAYQLDTTRLASMPESEVILQALAFQCPILDEFESYLNRKGARYDRVYEHPLDPDLRLINPLRPILIIQSIQAITYLECGDSEKAMERIQKALRLQETLANEPFTYSQEFRVELLHYSLTSIWEGWRRSAWDSSQLESLERSLASIDFIPGWKQSVRYERLVGTEKAEPAYVKKFLSRQLGPSADPAEIKFQQAAASLVPPSLWYLNRIHLCEDLDRYILGSYDEHRHVFQLDQNYYEDNQDRLMEISPDRFLSDMYIFRSQRLTETVAFAEASLALARLALACSRYRLMQGHWPANLEPLLSEKDGLFGIDPFSGSPLRYLPPSHDNPSRLPTFYSVSLNGVDDSEVAGSIIFPYSSQGYTYWHGDWVWAAH